MIEATVNFHDEAPPPLTYTFRTTYIEYTEGEVVDIEVKVNRAPGRTVTMTLGVRLTQSTTTDDNYTIDSHHPDVESQRSLDEFQIYWAR